MGVKVQESSSGVAVFPSSDHFPLGRRFGAVDSTAEPASRVRPFGLTLGVRPRAVSLVDSADIGYDEQAQVGLFRDGDGRWVPMSRHTDGQTGTVTDRGDGQGTNRDSDTDYRED